jgi:hypothetical protein
VRQHGERPVTWNPWRECRRLRKDLVAAHRLGQRLLAESHRLHADLRETERRLAEYLVQPGGAPEGRVDTGTPEFVMVGLARPDGTKRLIASRMPGVLAFGMTDYTDPPPRWQVHATLPNAAFIDKASYSGATAHLFEMWANADAEALRQQEGSWNPNHPCARLAVGHLPRLPLAPEAELPAGTARVPVSRDGTAVVPEGVTSAVFYSEDEPDEQR